MVSWFDSHIWVSYSTQSIQLVHKGSLVSLITPFALLLRPRMVIRLLQPALLYFQIYGRWLRSTVGKWKIPQNLAWFFVMIAWMYCVGEGRGSCEVATMSKSLPSASLFCWFCKYEAHELVYFLTFRKNGIMFCSFGNKSESFFIWMIHLFVFGTETLICQISALGWLVGGGMGVVNCEANNEPHMFSLYFR